MTPNTEVIVNATTTYYFEASVSSNPGCIDTAASTLHLIENLEITLENGDPVAEHYCANDEPFVLKGFPAGGTFCVLDRNCPTEVEVTPVDDDKNDTLKVWFCFNTINDANAFLGRGILHSASMD